jgi:hypothetical protein
MLVFPKYSLAAVSDWQALLVENAENSIKLNDASAVLIVSSSSEV